MNTQPFENTSQGLGTAPALVNVDLNDEVIEGYDPRDVSRKSERYLVFAGSVLPQSQLDKSPALRMGGEYFGTAYRTMKRSNGLLRRCQITPLEIGYDFMSTDMIGDDPRLHVVATVTHEAQMNPATGRMMAPAHEIHGIEIYPGDEIEGILSWQRQEDNAKGILEIEQLRAVSYSEFKASGLQEFIFPEWQKIMTGYAELPTKISILRSHLEGRKNATGDADIKGVIDVYLHSCDQFYRWGKNRLKYESMLVRMAPVGGHVHTYSELAEQLFDWLEIRREDLISKDADIAEIIAKATAGNSVSGGEVTALLAKMTELLEKTTLAQNSPPPPPPPLAVESVTPIVDPVYEVGSTVSLNGEAGTITVIKPAGWFDVETASGTQTVRKDKFDG